MANRYWVGGSGTWNTVSTTNWSTASGGGGGASVPTAADSVFFDQAGTYTVTLTGALTCLDITVSAGTVTFAQGTSPTLAISGSMSLLAGTIWSANGQITFNATTTGKTITTNGVTLGGTGSANARFAGAGGGWTLGSALTCAGNFIFNAGVLNTANFNLTVFRMDVVSNTASATQMNWGSSTVTITDNQLRFQSGGGTNIFVLDAGTSQLNLLAGATVTANSRTFNNVSFLSVTANSIISTPATFNNLTIAGRTTAGVKNLSFDSNITVNGTFTVSAGTDATMRNFIISNTAGTARTLTCAAVSLTDADFRDITIAGAAAPASGTRLGDCKGNSGITFDAAKTVYWNLAGKQNWSATGWALTSTGTPAVNNFPLAQDTATFTNAGSVTGTITINGTFNIGTLDMSGRTSSMTLSCGFSINIYGNYLNGTGTTLSVAGMFVFAGRGSQTITGNGITFSQSIRLDNPGGTLTLQDNITTTYDFTSSIALTNGTLDLNGKTLTLSGANSNFRALTGGSKNITFNGGTLVIAGTGTQVFFNQTAGQLTTTAGTGTGTIRLTSASAKTFVGNGATYNCTLDQGGAGVLTISDSNTFTNITNTYKSVGATTIRFTAGTTQTFSNFNANGESGRVLTIDSSSAGTQATLSKSSGIVNVDYLSIRDSNATGGATWNAGNNSTNVSNNTGWIFPAPVFKNGNFFLMFA